MCNPLLCIPSLPFIHATTALIPPSPSFMYNSLLRTFPRALFFPRASAVIYKWLSAVIFADVGHGVITELTKGLELIIDEAPASGVCHLSTWQGKKCQSLNKVSHDEAQMHGRLNIVRQQEWDAYFHVTAWSKVCYSIWYFMANNFNFCNNYNMTQFLNFWDQV